MTKRRSLCGAETRRGGTCRNSVAAPGERCRLHRRKPLGRKKVLPLCYKVIERLAQIGGAYALFEKIHPNIVEIVNQLGGLLMPEHFWHMGFGPKDREEMQRQIELARRKRDRIARRYEGYPAADKLAVEQAYYAILRIVELAERSEAS